jgi:hypothetical protein
MIRLQQTPLDYLGVGLIGIALAVAVASQICYHYTF